MRMEIIRFHQFFYLVLLLGYIISIPNDNFYT